jgi:hypothetical protein
MGHIVVDRFSRHPGDLVVVLFATGACGQEPSAVKRDGGEVVVVALATAEQEIREWSGYLPGFHSDEEI